MKNIPKVNPGIIAVSRDCFPIELSRKRRIAVVNSCKKKKIPITEIETVIENEKDVLKALKEIEKKGINALVIYLGNFGPEGPTTMLAQKFGGPVMFTAAAEETGKDLIHGRGDAYCGLLNTSYNSALRGLKPYIPEYPVGISSEITDMIKTENPFLSNPDFRSCAEYSMPPCFLVPGNICSMIASGFSDRGLSEVTIDKSHNLAAISPIRGRFSLSRSPPHPKTQMIRAGAISFRAEIAFSRASGVCA